MLNIAIIGEFTPEYVPHIATNNAIEHSCNTLGLNIGHEWVSSDDITPELFAHYQGIWIAPGSPYKNMENVLWAIKHARENSVPTLGTCGGFQHMIIELARNLLGFFDAQHGEYNPDASRLFISRLDCSLAGRELPITLTPGSHTARIYGANEIKEQYYCNFGVNPAYVELIKASPLNVVGADAEGEIRIIEHPKHPFFIGTLFVPQARSTATQPHPLVSAFIEAVEKSEQIAPQINAARTIEWEL
jgi:CTP synthase (UTP-ammonia lyase)